MLKNILIFFISVFFAISLLAQSNSKMKLAQSYERSGSFTDAVRLYKEVYNETGNNTAFNGLIRGYKYLNMNNELLELLENKLKTEQNPEIYVLLGEAYWKAGKVKEANNAWDKALKNETSKEYIYTELSKIQTELQLLDKAINSLEIGREELDSRVENAQSLFVNELSKLYIANGDTEKALEEVFKLLEQNGNIATVQARIYTLMTTEKNIPLIREYINDYVSNRTSSFVALQLKSWFHMNVNEYEKALETIIEADDLANNEARMVYEFAKEAERDGKLDIALDAYQNIVDRGRSNRFFSSATYNYTRALESKYLFGNKIDKEKAADIIERYETIIDEFRGSNTAAKAYIAKSKIESNILNDVNEAIETLIEMDEEISAGKAKAEGLILLSELYLVDGNSTDALKLLNNALERYSRLIPEFVSEAKYKVAQINYLKGNIDSAKAQLNRIKPSNDEDIYNNILEMKNILNNSEKSTEFVKKYSNAEYLLIQRDTSQAISEFEAIFNTMEDVDSEIWQMSGLQLAELHMDKKDYSSVEKTTQKFISKLPDGVYSDKALIYMGEAQESKGDKKSAIDTLTKILVDFPNSIYLDDIRQKIRELRGES